MIYILIEQFMNGTVTMSIESMGVEAPTFKEAVCKIQNRLSNKFITLQDNEETFSYTTHGDFPIFGHINNHPLQII